MERLVLRVVGVIARPLQSAATAAGRGPDCVAASAESCCVTFKDRLFGSISAVVGAGG